MFVNATPANAGAPAVVVVGTRVATTTSGVLVGVAVAGVMPVVAALPATAIPVGVCDTDGGRIIPAR